MPLSGSESRGDAQMMPCQLLVNINQLRGSVSLVTDSIIQINTIQCHVVSMIDVCLVDHHDYVKYSYILMCSREREREKEYGAL